MTDPTNETALEPQKRESVPAVLAVAFGLGVIALSVLGLVFVSPIQELVGEELLEERFAAHALPDSFAVVDAIKLIQGEEVVFLSDPEIWRALREEEAKTWGRVRVEDNRSFGDDFGSGGPGRGRRSGRGSSFRREEGGPPKEDWSKVEASEPGQPPWELAFAWYPREKAEGVLRSQFGGRNFGDLGMLGEDGGKITVSSGPVEWQGYETYYAVERQFAKLDDEKRFRDILRINLTLGTRCCVLYAKWPTGAPASLEPVAELLSEFEPLLDS